MRVEVQPVDVALKDGSTVRVRPVEPGDVDALRALLAGMSENSRWLRFLSAGANLDRAARSAADPGDGASLVVTAGTPERIVAHAMYALERADRAEVAFEVADEWHGRGIATILLAHLASIARQAGVTTFVAYVHPTNRRMIGVFRESGFPVEVHSGPGELEVEMPAALGDAARLRFEDRERAAAVAAVGHALRPRSLLVVTTGGTTASATVMRNLRTEGYEGELHVAVTTGEAARELPAADLAILAVRSEEVLDHAAACGAAGVRALAVLTGGVTGIAELLATCRRTGMRLVGPSSLGVLNTDPSLRLNATAVALAPPTGPVALASQSGAIGVAAIAEAARRGLGLSSFVSMGDKADLSSNDFLRFWEQDPATRVVLLYLESFGNPRRFARVARRVAAAKPIVAVKSGRPAVADVGPSTRTRALLSAADVSVDALFEHAGVIRTDTVAEQFDVAALLASQPPPAGGRVGIISNGRGPAISCADACAAAGLAPSPPDDLGANAAPREYAAAVGRIAPDVDAVIAVFVPITATNPDDVARALAEVDCDVTLIGAFMALGEAELAALPGGAVPLYRSPVEAARALGRVARHASWRRRPAGGHELEGIDADAAAAVIAAALSRGEGWLLPGEADALLSAYGIPLVETRLAASAEEVGRIAAEIGAPVAVKAHCPELPHRSDVGAVALGVTGAAQAQRAASETTEAVRRAGGEPAGTIVQRMAPAGIELVAGVLADPDFGPVVACGLGGRTAELLADVAVRLAPLSDADARDLVRSLRSFPLLEGHRGAPAADVPALEDLLRRVAALAAAHGEVVELDLDPVLAAPAGARAVDARIRVRPAAPPRPFPALDR
jgi:acyl-CoA synthetase (NDP forming)/GNAT superfamily N-acetyltransferase